jgi:hypothetical protein
MDDIKNTNFVQFNRGVMAQHRQLVLKNALAASILSFFIEKMGKNNTIVCSYQVLQEITGYSRPSVARALKVLKEDRWVQAIRIGSAHAYAVNSAAFWSSWGNGKKYSVFHATVIASESEQKEAIATMEKIKLKHMPVLDINEQAVMGAEELPPPDQKDLDV